MKLQSFLVNLRTAIYSIDDEATRKRLLQLISDFSNCKEDPNND
jgi:6-phosphogluconate dehydrogenase